MGQHTPAAIQRRLVALWRDTDTSMAAFARQHGVKPKTFGAWVTRHPPALPAPAGLPGFVQVAVPTASPPQPEVSVIVGGHALHFDAPPPAGWFAAVVRELSPC